MPNFDFNKIMNVGRHSNIYIKPTIYISTTGYVAFYALDLDIAKQWYIRIAVDNKLVGFEFSTVKYPNPIALSAHANGLRCTAKSIIGLLNLNSYIGEDNRSSNYELKTDERRVYYFNLTEPVTIYK